MVFPQPFSFWQQSGVVFPSSGLISYWKADTNGSFPDAHGSNDGTINGASYTASGKINGAYSYGGDGDYINLNSSTIMDVDTAESKSFAFWVYPATATSGNYASILSNRVATSQGVDLLFANQNSFRGYIRDTANHSQWTTPVSIAGNTWYHVVFVVERGAIDTVKTYVDGTLEETDSISTLTTDIDTASNARLGWNPAESADKKFGGTIDEVGIWNRVLIQSEITALYNGGSGLPYS